MMRIFTGGAVPPTTRIGLFYLGGNGRHSLNLLLWFSGGQRMASAVGTLLREWRTARRLSQLELAMEVEVSTRHLSFIETGRSKPSREMVLLLSSALDVPLRDRNALLHAAGYAPAYRETDLVSPEKEQMRQALKLILRRTTTPA
jgi:transcriptional regulator with XRE-family HTH domain